MGRGRFGDFYLWTQAVKVVGFIVYAFTLILVERLARAILSLVTCFIPTCVLQAIQRKWHSSVKPSLPSLRRSAQAGTPASGRSFEEEEAERELYYDAPDLVRCRGYPFEEHFAEAPDGFLLGLHRIPHGRDQAGGAAAAANSAPRPAVYLMHGFLQSSEAWLSMRQNLPFLLADAGFDVWLGNSRGNKYSCHHRTLSPHTDEYWSFCIDDVASKDVPTALTYILGLTGRPSLSYVGFSQGTAVAFACFSTRPDIARMVNSFVALAPATQAKGFSQPMLDSVAKLSPDIVYLLLGRGSLFGNLFLFWQNRLTNAQLIRVIDFFVAGMFHWSMKRVHPSDKPVLYAHIYSMSSVQSVVHWFQIMRAQRFQMYVHWRDHHHHHQRATTSEVAEAITGFEGGMDSKDSPVPTPSPSPMPDQADQRALDEYPLDVAAAGAVGQPPSTVGLEGFRGSSVPCAPSSSTSSLPLRSSLPPSSTRVATSYRGRVAQVYPLRQISCPIHVLWGSADHLPDTQGLLRSLPAHATAERFDDYEHLDFLYAREALQTVYPGVIERLQRDTDRWMNDWREKQIQQQQTGGFGFGLGVPPPQFHHAHPLSTVTLQQLSLGGQRASAFSPPAKSTASATVAADSDHLRHRRDTSSLSDASAPPSQRVSPTPSIMSTASEAATSPSSARSPSASSSSMEALFIAAVLKRDGGRCVVCQAGGPSSAADASAGAPSTTSSVGPTDEDRDARPLVAVQIVPPSGDRASGGLAQAKLLHAYETTNGLTLCWACSASFELGQWYIQPTDGCSLVISPALPPVQPEWRARVGARVTMPTHFKRHWPTPHVFSVQQQFAEAEWRAARKRHAKRQVAEGQKEM